MADDRVYIKIGNDEETHRKSLVDPDFNPDKPKDHGGGLYDIRHTGFYYDSQISDETMIMSLHPSTFNTDGKWETFKEGYTPFLSGDIKYSYTPIAVCLLTEDPSFAVSNRFADFNGGNPIEDLFNSFKPYAPLLEKFSKNVDEINTADNLFGATGTRIISEGVNWLGKFAGEASSVLNKALFVQGTRYTYYNGSDFSTGMMEMKFTKFSEYNKKGEFIDVAKYIGETLSPYCFGRYRCLSETGADNKEFSGPISGNIARNLAEYVGVQSPPGGFKMDAKSLDSALFGTLRLNIGGIYAIENLLVKNMTFSFSRSEAKDPENPGRTVPLYADITLSLCPAAMVTDNSVDKILSGNGLENSIKIRADETKKILEKMKNDRKKQFDPGGLTKIRNY